MRGLRTCMASLLLLELGVVAQAGTMVRQTNLVSNQPGVALLHDPDLINAWGISFSPTSPFWVSANGTNISTLYGGDVTNATTGIRSPLTKNALEVSVPPHTPFIGPTGQVNNPTTGFQVTNGTTAGPSRFIFASLDGSISGWNPAVNPTNAIVGVQQQGAAYTGLGIGTTGGQTFLYAANVAGGTIDVFNSSFLKTTLAGSFVDPNLPAGFVPFNIQNLGNTLYVTYENMTSGGGVVSAFDLQGNFLRRIADSLSGIPLAAPWGLAIAPASWGAFANALLVGNLQSGLINAFDPLSGAFLGHLLDDLGNPLVIDGLWGLTAGSGGNAGDRDAIYFAAGPDFGQNGLFGSLRQVPEPSTIALLAMGMLALAWRRGRRKKPADD